MVTRAKRASNNKWDAENMKVLGCKMRRDRAEAFQALCKVVGTSPNEVFRAAAEAFMLEHGGQIGTGAQGGDGGQDQEPERVSY